jgi:hypothetical protein
LFQKPFFTSGNGSPSDMLLFLAFHAFFLAYFSLFCTRFANYLPSSFLSFLFLIFSSISSSFSLHIFHILTKFPMLISPYLHILQYVPQCATIGILRCTVPYVHCMNSPTTSAILRNKMEPTRGMIQAKLCRILDGLPEIITVVVFKQ